MQQSPQSSSFVTSRFAQLFLLLFLLVSLFSFGNGVGSEVRKKDRGLIIVPGLGRDDRLQTVVHNIKLLLDTKPEDHKHKVKWDCIIYIYAPRSDSFWQETSHLNYLTNFCKLIENPGKRCTEHLYMAQPALFQHSYEYVFILLDDCKFDPKISQPLDKLLDIMLCNNLTIVSPMVSNITCHSYRCIIVLICNDYDDRSLGPTKEVVRSFATSCRPQPCPTPKGMSPALSKYLFG